MTTRQTERTRRPSITDVARRAGVSVGTVSNVLNRPEQVAPLTRERVQSAIEDLGFVRNASARQLRSGTLSTLGAILLDIANPFFTDIARGIEDRITADEYTLVVSSSDGDGDRESRYLRLHEEHGVQGLIISPARESLEDVLAVRDRGVHVVLLDATRRVPGLSSVGVDDVRGGALAAEHLLAMGHRRLGFVTGPSSIRQCVDRRTGFVAALEAAGLDPREALVDVQLPALTIDTGDRAMSELLALDPARRPTATFCCNDLAAVGALRALRRADVPVPGGMALVGYDDVLLASLVAVPITSVRQPTHTLGWTAADLLLRESAAGRESRQERVLFQPELVERESTLGFR